MSFCVCVCLVIRTVAPVTFHGERTPLWYTVPAPSSPRCPTLRRRQRAFASRREFVASISYIYCVHALRYGLYHHHFHSVVCAVCVQFCGQCKHADERNGGVCSITANHQQQCERLRRLRLRRRPVRCCNRNRIQPIAEQPHVLAAHSAQNVVLW